MTAPANPYADRAGLARLMHGGWMVLERVQASKDGIVPTIHAAEASKERTLCGRIVTFRYGAHPTDTVSMVDCLSCRNRIARTL